MIADVARVAVTHSEAFPARRGPCYHDADYSNRRRCAGRLTHWMPPRATRAVLYCARPAAREAGGSEARGWEGVTGMAGKRIRAARTAGVLACAAFASLLTLLVALPSAGADPTPSLTIQTPAPIGPTSEGPVGTNVTVAGQGFTPTDTVVLGYASADQGCATGEVNLDPSISGTVGPDGSFTLTFPWPASAPNIGARYFICATDTTPATPGTPTPSVPVRLPPNLQGGREPAAEHHAGAGAGSQRRHARPRPRPRSRSVARSPCTAANYQPGGKPLEGTAAQQSVLGALRPDGLFGGDAGDRGLIHRN